MNAVEVVRELVKEHGEEILYGGFDEFELVSDEHIDSGRWQEYRLAVLKVNDSFVGVRYSRGLTEYQDGDEPEDWEIYKVKPVEKTIVEYVKV